MKHLKLFSLFSLVALLGFVLMPATTFAQEADTEDQSRIVERLEAVYGRLQEVSVRGDERLAQAENVVVRANELIAMAQEKGYDTASLEGAVANFETAIANATALKADGDAILSSHAGFDDNGNVTDIEQATETLRSVQNSFKEGRQTLRDSARELRHTFRDFRRDHRGDANSA